MSMTVFVTQSRHLLATKQHVSMTVFVTQSQHVFATKHHVSMTSLTWSFCHQSCYFDFPPFPPLAVLTADQSKLTATYHEIDLLPLLRKGFLSRLPLPRLVHFLDMILPQMVPVKSLPVVLALATSWKSGVEATTPCG